ncbi:hypothetical protein HZC00_03365 [Candidatus Kaiserbacteria bacterium]|nr:hypothetical protein [Candidatus Kaiserbacteria bacterium]
MKTLSSYLLRTSVFAASAFLLLATPLITSAWTTTTPPGLQTYGTPGSYDFVVPANAGDITVEMWGGGGGGSGGHWVQSIFGQDLTSLTGRTGGVSSFNTSLIANGGTGGIGSNNGGWYWLVFVPAQGGAGGTAAGGDLNLAGGNGSIQQGGAGGGPGGAGGTITSRNGGAPGGGGGGGPDANFAGGGGGGYTKKVYLAGTLAAGAHIPVRVGASGASIDPANTGSGAPGSVKITWTGATANNEPQPQASAFSQSTTATQNPSVGGTDTITATIRNNGGATSALIDIEVYQNGTKVGQKFFDNQSFNTNESHAYTYPFTVPSAGTYTVSIGVFHAGWAGMFTWFDQVASFTAVSGGGGGGQALSIYQDALAQGWENWSWGSTQNFSDASLVFSGTRSMKVTYNAPWGGLFLHHAGVNTTGKSTLNFAIAGGGASGQQLQIYTSDSNGIQSLAKNLSAYISGGITANTWKQVSIPLADIGAANKTLSGIVIQDISGGTGASIYIDAMQIQ